MSTLVTAAKAIVPNGVVVMRRDPQKLWPMTESEAAHVAKAVPKRRAEFSAGRAAARACLQMLGAADVSLDVKNRAPVWPRGFTGSITHSGTACLAVAGPTGVLAAIGIDLEPDEPLPSELVSLVLRPDEDMDGRLAFSAKEAVYKAVSYHLSDMLEFHDLRLCQHQANRYQAQLMIDAGPWHQGHVFDIAFAQCEHHILSICTIAEGDLP